jgi:hypothetical protein
LGPITGAVFLISTLKAAGALFPFEMKEPPDKPNSYVSKPTSHCSRRRCAVLWL